MKLFDYWKIKRKYNTLQLEYAILKEENEKNEKEIKNLKRKIEKLRKERNEESEKKQFLRRRQSKSK